MTIMEPSLGTMAAIDLQEAVARLATERSRLLQAAGRYPPKLARDLAGGRLLCYAPYENLAEGSEAEETQGYFDLNAAPPWDSWIILAQAATSYYTPHTPWPRHDPQHGWYGVYIVSWVAADWVARVHQGLTTSTTECVYWADDLTSPLLNALRQIQVLPQNDPAGD